jgi:hypothetical protein
MKRKPVDKKKIKKVVEKVKLAEKTKKQAPVVNKAAEKKKRLSTKEIKLHLILQLELDKAELTKAQHSLPSLDVMKDVEQARARMHLCKDMLSMFWWDR